MNDNSSCSSVKLTKVYKIILRHPFKAGFASEFVLSGLPPCWTIMIMHSYQNQTKQPLSNRLLKKAGFGQTVKKLAS
jgi:hypothetical protein